MLKIVTIRMLVEVSRSLSFREASTWYTIRGPRVRNKLANLAYDGLEVNSFICFDRGLTTEPEEFCHRQNCCTDMDTMKMNRLIHGEILRRIVIGHVVETIKICKRPARNDIAIA